MNYGVASPRQRHRREPATVRSILKNEKYVGDAILQKRVTTDFLTKINEGEAPQYYVENGHPPIVSRTVWQDVQSALDDIARGKLDIRIDGLMIRILIHKMVVTPKQTLVIHFLDGSTYCHRLGATPRGKRLYNAQQNHSRILALYTDGCSAKEISQQLGISVNTVRSFLRRYFW